MLDICLLGTGGMMPLPYRWLTSMMARYNGTSILMDCGEGTQIAMKEKGVEPQTDRCHLLYPIFMQTISADFRECFSRWEMQNGQSRFFWWDRRGCARSWHLCGSLHRSCRLPLIVWSLPSRSRRSTWMVSGLKPLR